MFMRWIPKSRYDVDPGADAFGIHYPAGVAVGGPVPAGSANRLTKPRYAARVERPVRRRLQAEAASSKGQGEE